MAGAVKIPEPEVHFLPLERLLELKLASGMSAPHRLRDLADVLEVIRVRQLPREFDQRLDESVREKYRELWTAVQGASDE
jgi:transcriptional regulator GlxA family with amidase domain